MDQNENPGPLAHEVAERILSAIYGPDLTGCQVTPDSIALIVQEGLNAQAKQEHILNSLFVQVLERIQVITTPPDRSEVKDAAHLAGILGERADAIRVIVSETLKAWSAFHSAKKM